MQVAKPQAVNSMGVHWARIFATCISPCSINCFAFSSDVWAKETACSLLQCTYMWVTASWLLPLFWLCRTLYLSLLICDATGADNDTSQPWNPRYKIIVINLLNKWPPFIIIALLFIGSTTVLARQIKSTSFYFCFTQVGAFGCFLFFCSMPEGFMTP